MCSQLHTRLAPVSWIPCHLLQPQWSGAWRFELSQAADWVWFCRSSLGCVLLHPRVCTHGFPRTAVSKSFHSPPFWKRLPLTSMPTLWILLPLPFSAHPLMPVAPVILTSAQFSSRSESIPGMWGSAWALDSEPAGCRLRVCDPGQVPWHLWRVPSYKVGPVRGPTSWGHKEERMSSDVWIARHPEYRLSFFNWDSHGFNYYLVE